MFKITYRIKSNNLEIIEYGFSKYILKRWISLNDQENIEVLFCVSLCKTFKIFLKCLIKKQVIL